MTRAAAKLLGVRRFALTGITPFALTGITLFAFVGCSSAKKHEPPPAAGPLIQVAHDLAEKVCACGADRDCLHSVRDEWDAQKLQLLGNGGKLTGDDKTKFDAEIARIHMCGDGGGLTFWDQ